MKKLFLILISVVYNNIIKTNLFHKMSLFIYLFSTCFNASCQELNYISFKDSSLTMDQVLSEYLKIESVSGNEKLAGQFLKDICKNNNLYIKDMGNDNGNYNFSASIYPLSLGKPNIIFLNHIDVVPAGDLKKWKEHPYSGKITKNEIWGRGAFDNKGAAIMQLFSILEIANKYKNEELKYNITMLSVSCEETQCNGGVKYVVDNYLNILNPIVVIGEGPPSISGIIENNKNQSVFGISIAHKRALWLELELDIETNGHGSVTPKEYANKEMIISLNNLLQKNQKLIFNNLNTSILKELGGHERGIRAFILKNPYIFKFFLAKEIKKRSELLALFTNTITLTSFDSHNNVINIIPDKVTALLDCRLLNSQLSELFIKELKNSLNEKIKIKIINEMPKMIPSSVNNIFYLNLKESILQKYPNSCVIPLFTPNFNDTGIFRSKRIAAFSTIPVNLDMEYLSYIHNYNERIPRNILSEGKEVYVDFIEKSINIESP